MLEEVEIPRESRIIGLTSIAIYVGTTGGRVLTCITFQRNIRLKFSYCEFAYW